jgi:hypothetical protein
MGMFDNIFCKAQLPLNDILKGLDIAWDEIDFQTKDLENSLTTFTINEDNTLVQNVVEYEYIPYTEEEKKSRSHRPWEIWKNINVINKYDKIINHHGMINFYTSLEYTKELDVWVEFNAFFIYGKLDKIELFKFEEQKAQSIINAEIEEKLYNQQKKFKYKIKRFLNRFGWARFCLKLSKVFRSISNFFQKIEIFIRLKIC